MGMTTPNGGVFAKTVHDLLGGHGDRINKFEISIQPPSSLKSLDFLSTSAKTNDGTPINTDLSSSENQKRVSMLCKSASIPGKDIGTVDIWRRGQKFTIRDTATFPGQWSCEFYNDTNLSLRRAFEKWMYEIDRHKALIVPTTLITNSAIMGYMGEVFINKKNTSNSDNLTYILKYAFPIKISEIPLSTESTGVTTFTVTFAYSYWEVEEDTNGFVSKILTYI